MTDPVPSPTVASYPLAVQDPKLTTALKLWMRTWPYSLTRFGILLAVSVIVIVWLTVSFGGFAWLGQSLHPFVGYVWLFATLGMGGALWRMVLRYGLYLLKCGHVAVLTELITRGQLGDGQEGQFAYGKRVVQERFGQVNALFAVDVLVHGVVRALHRTLDGVTNLLPVPGLRSMMALVKAILHAATTYIDETIFSFGLARGDDDPWRAGRDGLVYYGQNTKPILKTAILVVILDKAATVCVWFFMLVPAIGVALLLPEALQGALILPVIGIACLFAANVRSAFLEPLFLVMVMVRFHTAVQGQEPSQEWIARLDSVSGKFRTLTDNIGSWKKSAGEAPAAVEGAVTR